MNTTLENLAKLKIAGMLSDAACNEAICKVKAYLTANPLLETTEKELL